MSIVTSTDAYSVRRPSQITLGIPLAVAYLVAVLAVEALRRAAGFPSPAQLAASPDAIASAKAWVLLTSAFVVSGPPALELTGVVAAAALLIRRHGAFTFWGVALVGHVGATLVAYCGVAVLWLTSPHAVEHVLDRPDYGVSAVWLAVLGALFASVCLSLERGPGGRGERLVAAVCLCAAVVGFVFFPLLAGTEHLLAFFLGAVSLPAFERVRARRAARRSGASQVVMRS